MDDEQSRSELLHGAARRQCLPREQLDLFRSPGGYASFLWGAASSLIFLVFTLPLVATSSSPAQPLNRLSALVSGGAAAATRRTSQIGKASSPGLSGFSLRSEALSPDVNSLGSDRPRAKVTCSVGYGELGQLIRAERAIAQRSVLLRSVRY